MSVRACVRAWLHVHVCACVQGMRQKVGFKYDMSSDSADALAHEMVEDLSMDAREAETIAHMIAHEVNRVKGGSGSSGGGMPELPDPHA